MENMKKRAPRVVSGNTASSLYVQNADGHPLSSSISNVPQAEKQNKPEGNASSSQSTHPAMDMTEWEFQCLTRSLSSDILSLSKPLFFFASMGNWTPADCKKAMAFLFPIFILNISIHTFCKGCDSNKKASNIERFDSTIEKISLAVVAIYCISRISPV